MKKVHLILQSKGGVGKSLLTWMFANHFKNDTVFFIDTDESTKTSSSRLNILVSEGKSIFFPILNDNKKLEREMFLTMFERISKLKHETVFVDFGAPESEEFRKLLEFEIDTESLVSELKRINIELVLLIVVAGRDAFQSCMKYFNSMVDLSDGKIETNLLMNEGTFGGIEAIRLGKENLLSFGYSNFLTFGDLGDSQSGKDIINCITENQTPENLSFAGRLMFRKVMKQVEGFVILPKDEVVENQETLLDIVEGIEAVQSYTEENA